MTNTAEKIRAQANWLAYWHGRRRAHYAFLSLVRRLPDKVVYWCVIRAAVRVEPNGNPSAVTAEQMLKAWDAA